MPSTHRSSSDEGEKDSITRFVTSRQPSTTEVNIDIYLQTYTNVHFVLMYSFKCASDVILTQLK